MPIAPNVKCFYCGTPFHTPASRIKKNATGRFFCCMNCFRSWEATTKVVLQCAECGKEIQRYKQYADAHEYKFCGKYCHAAWKTKNTRAENHPRWVSDLSAPCDQCGTPCRQKKRYRNKHTFCSMKCFNAWMSANKRGKSNHNYKAPIVKPCDNCGEIVSRKPNRVGDTSRRYHFCSKKCKGEWMGKNIAENYSGPNSHLWKGGTVKYYGPNWKRQARDARKRDDHQCQHCGMTQAELGRKLDVHHIVPFREFGYVIEENDNYRQANRLSNLISLCPQCHRKVEDGVISVQPKS